MPSWGTCGSWGGRVVLDGFISRCVVSGGHGAVRSIESACVELVLEEDGELGSGREGLAIDSGAFAMIWSRLPFLPLPARRLPAENTPIPCCDNDDDVENTSS
jgi:hypothetical protein